MTRATKFVKLGGNLYNLNHVDRIHTHAAESWYPEDRNKLIMEVGSHCELIPYDDWKSKWDTIARHIPDGYTYRDVARSVTPIGRGLIVPTKSVVAFHGTPEDTIRVHSIRGIEICDYDSAPYHTTEELQYALNILRFKVGERPPVLVEGVYVVSPAIWRMRYHAGIQCVEITTGVVGKNASNPLGAIASTHCNISQDGWDQLVEQLT